MMVPDTSVMQQIGQTPKGRLTLAPHHWQAIVMGGALVLLVVYRRAFRELMPS